MGRAKLVDVDTCCSVYDFDWKGFDKWLKKNLPGSDKKEIKSDAIQEYGSDYDVISQFLEEVVEPTLPNNEGFIVQYDRDKDHFAILHIRVGEEKRKDKKKR